MDRLMTTYSTAAPTFAAPPGCAPCAAATTPVRLAADAPQPYAGGPDAARLVSWSGVIGVEGVMTGDGRLIERNALDWGDLPIPLRLVVEDVGAHDGAAAVGRITSITRGRGGRIQAAGDIDVSAPAGAEAARLIGGQIQSGVSMDLDNVSFEVRVAADLLDGPGAPADPAEAEVDADGRVTVLDIEADAEVMVTTSARIRAATLVAVPAFIDARIELDDATLAPAAGSDGGPSLAAAGGPLAPPGEWFTDPGLGGPTPFTVTDDGRVFGHLALWDTCHVSFTMSGQCVTPPRSAASYAHFRLGSTRTREGRDVPTGVVTMNARHAPADRGPVAALAHYEDTGLAAADVAVGEDQWGIWVAGALRPGLAPETVRALRAAPLSGDWRRVGSSSGLELVAALAVNTPGFPVPRAAGLVAGGSMLSLVAAGAVTEEDVERGDRGGGGVGGGLSPEDARALARLARRTRKREREAVDEMAVRLRADSAASLRVRVARAGVS